jgi:Zn-dependent protease with chaperone function
VSGLAVLLTVAFVVAAQGWLLPAAAEFVARRIPLEYESALGNEAVATLDELSFAASRLSTEQQDAVRAGFLDLLSPSQRSLPQPAGVRLEFRDFGGAPNAFALPGGIVVVTDALVEQCKSGEVTAVLAHELGHVGKRHALRQLVLGAGTGAILAAVLGDASSIALFAGTAPGALLELKYSRELETEADDHAFDLLRRRGIRPSIFADALTCLERSSRRSELESTDENDEHADGSAISYLSTHPDSAARIRRFRGAP